MIIKPRSTDVSQQSSVTQQPLPESQETVEPTTKGKTSDLGKIRFEKTFVDKVEDVSRELKGSLALTVDSTRAGMGGLLHKLFYYVQLLRWILEGRNETGHNKRNLELCHGEVILDVETDENSPKKGHIVLAHAVFQGVKTTMENHKARADITGMQIYSPVDEKMKKLFLKYAKQTAVHVQKKPIDIKAKKVRANEFSNKKMIACAFYRQVLEPIEQQQKHAALAAADLLLGGQFKDENGNLASFYCISYMLTLTQGIALISALDDVETAMLRKMDRETIAQYIVEKINEKDSKGDLVKATNEKNLIAATYWNNAFMRTNAQTTMSYTAGNLLDQAADVA